MKKLLFMSVLCLSALGFTGELSTLKEDAKAIDAACAPEAKAADCGGKVAGRRLLKCIYSYKRANTGYKFSDDCQAAIKKAREDRKAVRGVGKGN